MRSRVHHFRVSTARACAVCFCRLVRPAAVVAALVCASWSPVRAQSMEPLSYTNAPIGLNFLVVGYAYQTGDVLVDPTLPLKNIKATIDDAFVAYSRVISVWGQSGNLAMVMPYAWLSATGDVFEKHTLVDRAGLGDLALRLSVNLVGAPALSLGEFPRYQQDLIVGVSFQMTAPSGQYLPSKLVNIGSNRWSFKPEFGMSKALGSWTLEGAVGVTLFTDNSEYFGNNSRHQDPLFSVQGHAIFNFTSRMWAALDATYYTGGRTALNGIQDADLQNNSRWGGTYAYALTRRNSIKLYFSTGLTARTGTEFQTYGIGWQHRWGAGL
jgi:outer membrane putative beta-barrel porin/alpha-amylase